MKTKYAQGAQRISVAMGDTSKPPVSVQLPGVASVGLPANAAQFMGAGMSVNVNANSLPVTQATESLAMFNASAGYNSSATTSHEGDVGGAA